MTSRIDPNKDGYSQLYPVAGVNNSSQGFRNNFTSLYGNLDRARIELTTLHDKRLVIDETGDIHATTVPKFVIDGQENDPVTLKLILRDNVRVPGREGMVVPNGTTSERPSTPALGTIRFNVTTSSLEFYTGDWVSLGGSGSYVSTAGDVVHGDIVMAGQGQVAQFLADPQYDNNFPSYAFSTDEDTGMAHPADGVITFLSNGVEKFRIDDTGITFSGGINSPKSTYGNSTESLFYLKNRLVNTWYTVAEMPISNPNQTIVASFHISFLYAGEQAGRFFSISGNTKASCVYQAGPTLDWNATASEIQATYVNALTGDVEFQVVLGSNALLLQCRATNDYGAGLTGNWDLTGKVGVHFGKWGTLPVNATYDGV